MRKLLTILLLLPLLSSAQLTVKQVVQDEYRTWYVYSDGHVRGYSNNGGTYIKQWQEPAGHVWAMVKPGFNYMNVLDAIPGHAWASRTFNIDTKDSFWRVDTDTTGADFGDLIDITYYSTSTMALRSDSTAWYWGNDVYSFFYAGGNLATWVGQKMLPTQFSTVKLRKIVMGWARVVGLSSDGLTVYEWVSGSRTPNHTINLPRPATDIFVAQCDIWGYLMPDATGSQTMGYPYIAGTSTSIYGGGSANSVPASLKTLWGLTQPIKKFDIDWQAIQYIDSTGYLWGCGWNSFGEVGNGVEFVGRYTYQSGNFSYGWPLNNGENPSGVPAKIGDPLKHDWVDIYSTNWYGTTKQARDSKDSIWVWGRNKAGVNGFGWFANNWTPDNSDMDQYHYNAMDIIVPTMVTPISAKTQNYNGTPPSTTASHNGHFVGNAVTLVGTGLPLKVFATPHPAGNGVDTLCCQWASFSWTVKSGPSGSSFSNGAAQTSSVSVTQNGRYVFQIQFNDNHSGIDTAQVPLYVNRINRVGGGRVKWH